LSADNSLESKIISLITSIYSFYHSNLN